MVKRGPQCGLKHQKENRSMDYFAGLDVSVKETSVCIVDDAGRIVREVKVASEPKALLATLKNPVYHFKRIGLEAGPGNKPQHENRIGSNPIGGSSSSTERWHDVPRGTMDEVSSHVRLDLPFV